MAFNRRKIVGFSIEIVILVLHQYFLSGFELYWNFWNWFSIEITFLFVWFCFYTCIDPGARSRCFFKLCSLWIFVKNPHEKKNWISIQKNSQKISRFNKMEVQTMNGPWIVPCVSWLHNRIRFFPRHKPFSNLPKKLIRKTEIRSGWDTKMSSCVFFCFVEKKFDSTKSRRKRKLWMLT